MKLKIVFKILSPYPVFLTLCYLEWSSNKICLLNNLLTYLFWNESNSGPGMHKVFIRRECQQKENEDHHYVIWEKN